MDQRWRGYSQIEVNVMPGDEKLQMTGQMDVMRMSRNPRRSH